MKNAMSKIVLVMGQTKWCLTIIVLLLLSAKMMAQIPNNGFENWTTVGSYENPTGWASTNSFSTGSFYAVTKSTDHYPVAVGNYSVRIENNTSLLSNNSGLNNSGSGVIMTEALVAPHPVFPITGHPNSFTGYYKFTPLNGDTMYIQIKLYNAGSHVSTAEYRSTASASSWTSFNIPFSIYTTADSGHMILAAYNSGPTSKPHGNSVLYIDNLNFDNLITSISKDQTDEIPDKYELSQNYPNPFNPTTKISYSIKEDSYVKLNVYNLIGEEVKILVDGRQKSGEYLVEFTAQNLPSGFYFYRIQAGNSYQAALKMILLK